MSEALSPAQRFQEALGNSVPCGESGIEGVRVEYTSALFTFYVDSQSKALTDIYDLSEKSPIQVHESSYGDNSVEIGLAPWVYAIHAFHTAVGISEVDLLYIRELLREPLIDLGPAHLEHLRAETLSNGRVIYFPTAEMLEAFGALPKKP